MLGSILFTDHMMGQSDPHLPLTVVSDATSVPISRLCSKLSPECQPGKCDIPIVLCIRLLAPCEIYESKLKIMMYHL